MIEVRIRHYDEVKPVHLCTWDAADLDSLIPTIRAWGLLGINGDDASDSIQGEFVADDKAAYFELVYGEEDDA